MTSPIISHTWEAACAIGALVALLTLLVWHLIEPWLLRRWDGLVNTYWRARFYWRAWRYDREPLSDAELDVILRRGLRKNREDGKV